MYKLGEDGTYSSAIPKASAAGTYNVYYYVAADSNYADIGSEAEPIGKLIVDIAKKSIDVTVNMDDLIYGESKTPSLKDGSNPGNGNVKYEYKLKSQDDNEYNETFPENVGEYIIKATVAETGNYKSGSATADFTISKKAITVTPDNVTKVYEDSDPEFTYSVDGLLDKDNKEDAITGELSREAGEDVSDEGYEISKGTLTSDNYVITVKAGSKLTIKPKSLKGAEITLNPGDVHYTGNEITQTVTSVELGDKTLEASKDYELDSDVSTIKATRFGDYKIVIKGKGNYTGSIETEWRIVDPNPPTGEISIKTDSWSSFLNSITFGHFFKDTQKVTITAQDAENESGVDKVYYCETTKACETKAELSALEWTEIANGGSFNIEPNKKVIIYAKITDRSGNITYINSNGIVVYSDAAKKTEKITYTKNSNQNVEAEVELNGNTIEKISLDDKELTKDTDYTLSEDGSKITFMKDYLEKLSTGSHNIKVSYAPLGETYVDADNNQKPADTDIVLDVVKAQGSISEIASLDKVYDAKEVSVPEFTTTNDKGADSANVTVEYKKAGEDTYKTERPKDAGDYTVRISVKEDASYLVVSQEKEFKISKKPVSATVSVAAKTYNKKADADVTVEIPTGIDSESFKVSDVKGTFVDDNGNADVNAGTDRKVKIDTSAVKVTSDTGAKPENYDITYPEFGKADIKAADIKVKVNDAAKHIGSADPAFAYSVAEGTLFEGDSLVITYKRAEGEAAGTYDINATAENNANYNVSFADVKGKLTIEDHVVEKDSAVAATCTEDGKTEGSHCSVCNKVLEEQKVVPALGHDYASPVFTWNEDFSAATAKFVCKRDVGHTETVEAKITSETTQPTESADGKTVYTATVELDGKTYTDTKEKIIPAKKADNKTVTKSVSKKELEKNALSLNANLKVTQVKNKIVVQWGRLKNASGYNVYVQYCGKKYNKKSINKVKKGKTTKITIKKVNGKKLNLKKNYKVYVQAYKISGNTQYILGKTIEAHIIGHNNKKLTNVKNIKLGKKFSKKSYTLKKGKKVKITAKTILVDKKKKTLSNAHAKQFRYATTNKKVATVSKKGIIKAVKKGKCVVYVYARNGFAKKINVKVK